MTDPTLEMAAKTPDLADRASSPVRTIPGDPTEPSPGLALCLSGGGYRAMLFHLGVVWRLNEAGVRCFDEGGRIRWVTHYGIERADIDEALGRFRDILAAGP